MFEIREDGDGSMEIWVNGVRVIELCSDDDDLDTASEVATAIAARLGQSVNHDMNYEWDPEEQELVPIDRGCHETDG